jgi:hypothetical protein
LSSIPCCFPLTCKQPSFYFYVFFIKIWIPHRRENMQYCLSRSGLTWWPPTPWNFLQIIYFPSSLWLKETLCVYVCVYHSEVKYVFRDSNLYFCLSIYLLSITFSYPTSLDGYLCCFCSLAIVKMLL